MTNQIDEEEKRNRLHTLNEKINKYSLESNKKYLGKTVKVLINGHSDKGDNMYSGYTDSMKLVNVKSNKDIIGQIVDVKITDAKSFSLDGEVV